MLQDHIVRYLLDSVEPIVDMTGAKAYRCAVTLKDGLYLPCVVMRNADHQLEQALDALRDARREGITDSSSGHTFEQYLALLRKHVLGGNRVSWHHIASIDASPFAIPMEKIREIRTEPNMTWIAFSATMDDGHEFSFGTPFATEFFEMPDGYKAAQIVSINPLRDRQSHFFREKPYFECFLDGL